MWFRTPKARAALFAATALLASALAGCEPVGLSDCSVLCGANGSCPTDRFCASDGYCHSSPSETSCLAGDDEPVGGQPDATVDPVGGADASPIAGADARPVDGESDAAIAECSPCELLPQCGCEGGACDLINGEPACRDVVVAGGQGSPCLGPEECAVGFSCTSNGNCQRFCDSDAMCTGSGGLCDLTHSGTGQRICTTACNPRTSAGCAGGWACALGYNPNTSRSHTNCRRAGSVQAFFSCSRNDECAPGLACATGYCRPYCIVGQLQCPSSYACSAFSPRVIVDGVEWGVCVVSL